MNSISLPGLMHPDTQYLVRRVDFALLAIQLQSPSLKADFYVAHTTDALCAAKELSRKFGGQTVLDQVDVPELHIGNIDGFPTFLDLYYKYISKSDFDRSMTVMTDSDSLTDHIRNEYGVENCITIKNYPEATSGTHEGGEHARLAIEPAFLEVFKPKSVVTFLGLTNLYTNDRVLRMSKTLVENGCAVKIFSLGDVPENSISGQVEFISIPH